MKNLIIISFLLLVTSNGFGQERTSVVLTMPLFNNSHSGNTNNKTRSYFEKCDLIWFNLPGYKKSKIGVKLTIESDGSISTPKLIEGTDTTMYLQVVKCLEQCPKWMPGTDDGVNVPYTLNFYFGKLK